MKHSILMMSAWLCVATATGADFYVATDGSDDHPGTGAQPFATLERARDAVRQWRTAADAGGPATVHLRGGVYELTETLALAAEDSGTKDAPVVWRNHASERVALSGGRRVAGFERVTNQDVLQRLPETARGSVFQADVRATGIADFGEVAGAGKRIELFSNDRPMTLARWPNEGFARIVDVTGGKPIKIHGIPGDAIGKFVYAENRPARWIGEPDVWLSGYWFWDWSDGRQRIRSIDPATRTIELESPDHNYGYRKGQRYYAFNALAELDSPGEWYLDRQRGLLYFWPPEDGLESAVLSVLPTLISLNNASWVTVRGLVLENTRATAITIAGGEGVRVGGCLIRNVGGGGVAVSGGVNHGVIGCDITQTGEGGVSLGGGDRAKLTPAGHFAENNHIHHYARLQRTYRPAVALSGVGNRVSHNLIHDAPHNAIQLGGNEHVIEFNEIHRVCQETGDVGAYYMGRDWTMRGNRIRHNYFHEISGPGLHGAMAVYLDDAASGTTIFGNVFYRASRAAFIGGGRDNIIENNVFVECRPSVHVDARGLGWMHATVAPGGLMHERLAAMPYQQPPWSTRYPELARILDENPPAPHGNRVVRNISVGGTWLNLEKAAEPGVTFEDNLVDQDPHFVDADQRNFQLHPDSPAWQLGFRKIPIEQIGLRDDQWRRARPVERSPRDGS
ncbi:MAG: right-handed parallel beta-helix repeat-containing protein [Pirellulales bacterium]|nr:right-handed parallel beta-helix repeat-containing protein [Pirellulales bacterium]